MAAHLTTTTLAAELIKIREAADLTQNQFAGIIGCSPNYVSKLERGVSIPSFELWMSLAGKTDLSEDQAVRLWAREHIPNERYRSAIPIG